MRGLARGWSMLFLQPGAQQKHGSLSIPVGCVPLSDSGPFLYCEPCPHMCIYNDNVFISSIINESSSVLESISLIKKKKKNLFKFRINTIVVR